MGVTDNSGGQVGACCARQADREMLASMGAGAETCIPLAPSFIAHDPFSHERGATHQAAAVLAKLREKRERQATPEAVAAVLTENPELLKPWREPAPSIAVGPGSPIPPGEPRPIGSYRAH
jgi:hypothetical protein